MSAGTSALLAAVAGGCCCSAAGLDRSAARANDADAPPPWKYMFWVLLTQPLMPLFKTTWGSSTWFGQNRLLLMSTCRLWAVRLPLILCFRHFTGVGPSGVWYAIVISNFIILILGALLFRRVVPPPAGQLQRRRRTEVCRPQ